MNQDFTPRLHHWMQSAGFSSFKALCQAAGVSNMQLRRLRQGQLTLVRVDTLLKLSHSLQIPVMELLAPALAPPVQPSPQPALTAPAPSPDLTEQLADLQHEYARLQVNMQQQREELWQEFQQTSVQMLESLLLQLPTAAYAAQQNPQAPAVRLLPLLRPIDQLLQAWGIEPIATVGSEVPYDPQQQQLMEGTAQPGDRVRVRYTGYRQGERLLYRAKVSPITVS